jgi:2-C-methyl-D-erythritol 4-phosphate cytidylyltransferase / 2-C-methyl-D-erythritol 2,4-cyclodiphosphate synthase
MSEPEPRLAGVLVAAGRGRRMGTDVDKLWHEAFGRAIWRWSLDALLAVPSMGTVAVVCPPDAVDRFAAAIPAGATDRCRLVAGGAARADSVRAGLTALTNAEVGDATVVLVHDAARPAATTALMIQIAAAVTAGAGAIPVVMVPDTLKRVRDGVVLETLDRTDMAAAQTPQAASLGILRAALDAVKAQGLEPTDEAAALAAISVPVIAVPGDPANRKLTEPADLELLHATLRARSAPAHAPPSAALVGDRGLVRAGLGFDAHRLEAGRALHLGGLAFPDEPRGLVGHSDGDAALHAVIDALLGAAALGDVGTLFPPDDPAWDGADSADMLRRAVQQIRSAGWAPRSVDLAVAAARPAIAPRRDEMAARIADLVGLATEAVTVRGTTSDDLGFAGSEGIAAWAVATVERTT